MVGAAKKQVVDDLLTAMKTGGFIGEQVVPGLIGPANSIRAADHGIVHEGMHRAGGRWIQKHKTS